MTAEALMDSLENVVSKGKSLVVTKSPLQKSSESCTSACSRLVLGLETDVA